MGIFVRIQGESAAESKTTFLSIGSPCKVEITGNAEVAVTVLHTGGDKESGSGADLVPTSAPGRCRAG